jgi:crotonobetainyl-CoA:carnitine CoA-transferase CaiB-like acyl-CoA transferase
VTFAPLAGIRVLDLAGEPLARAGRVLADLGADVVLVEPPGGSPCRRVPPLVATASGLEVSPFFVATAAGKRSITLDVRIPRGYDLFGRLAAAADVVLLSDDPDVLRARRLDHASLRAINHQLVYTSLTPFGLTGPRRRWAGSDLVAWAASGALVGIGDPDRRPVGPGGRLAYAAGSLNAVAGTVIALLARRRGGGGQAVDISLQEAVLSVTMETGPLFTIEGGSQARVGPRRATASGLFATKDGLVELDPYMPGQWDSLATWISDELGIEAATLDAFRGSKSVRVPFTELIDGWVEELAGRYGKQEFFLEAQRRGIPCGPVNEPADLLSDPHLAAVGAWVPTEYPGVGPIAQPRAPLRVGSEPLGAGAVPSVGQHNEEIYRGELGLTDADLAAIRSHGCI